MGDALTKWHAVGLVGSVAVHLGAFGWLATVPNTSRPPSGPSVVEFEVPPAPAPAPVPEPAPEPEPEPEPAAPAIPAAVAAAPDPAPEPAPEPEPEPAEPAAAEEAPVELAGLTLTNDGPGAGWSSTTGNGRKMVGPIRRPPKLKPASRERSERPVAAVGPRRPAKAATPALVPVTDLSQRPTPPPLGGKLTSHYPPDAKRRGEEGIAVVLARIEADGRIRIASVASESGLGFGEACRQTVIGSVWSPPLDAQGRAVATQIQYTCQFRVDR